jgi:hypothetical protein
MNQRINNHNHPNSTPKNTPSSNLSVAKLMSFWRTDKFLGQKSHISPKDHKFLGGKSPKRHHPTSPSPIPSPVPPRGRAIKMSSGKSRQGESNPRPRLYESLALPLSYVGA